MTLGYSVFKSGMLAVIIASGSLMLPALAGETSSAPDTQSQAVLVFDGIKHRNDQANKKISPGEDKVLKEKILPEAEKVWKGKHEGDVKVLATAEGSFTARGAKQRLIYYLFCDAAPVYVYGLVVMQNAKPVAHFCFEYGYSDNVYALPVISDTGLNSVGLQGRSMHQGFKHASLAIRELSPKKVKKFGCVETWYDNLGAALPKQDIFAYKIFGRPGKSSALQVEKYRCAKSRWHSVGKRTAVKFEDDPFEFIALYGSHLALP
jgi:hypothetical protein